MIPQRIELTGFLCYKEKGEVSFDSNATLWMLSGLNGSGKSSIFDAVTYALFGHHRGGSQHAVELINKDSDGLAVEFDFQLDERMHRIRRTLKRKAKGAPASTQQIYRYQPTSPSTSANGTGKGGGKWIALEGTHYKRQFEDWISENIGLTYETFTSSILLLQGKADKLLGSKAEERRAVLAGIVHLEHYEKLHTLADEKRRKLKSKFDDFSDRLAALPEVKAEELTAAEENIRQAEEIRTQAHAEVERLRELELQARGWMDLQTKLATARRRWRDAEKLLGESSDIERDVERLRELREVLPRLREIVKQRGVIREAEEKNKTLLHEKEKTAEQLLRHESAFAQERDKRTSLQKQIEEEEKQQRDLAPQLLAATARLETLKEFERQSCELESIGKELSLLPADAVEQSTHARSECEKLAALAQLLPRLSHFQKYRDDLRQADERKRTAQQELAQVKAHGQQLNNDLKRLESALQEADQAARSAKDRETEARTLLKQASDSLQEITRMHGAKVCRHCGSELTPGHLEEEKRRRGEEVRRAEERLKNVSREWIAAREREQHLREEEKKLRDNYVKARENYREESSRAKQADEDMARLQSDCARAYAELPEDARRQISETPTADWTTTLYPQASDLERLRAETAGYAAARQRWQQADEVVKQWQRLNTQQSDKVAIVARLQGNLPSDPQSARQTHGDLKLTLDALEKALKNKRGNIKEVDAALERLTRERQREQKRLDVLDLDWKKADLEGQSARQMIAANRKALPASWQTAADSVGAAEHNQWDQERADLEAKDVERRGQELQSARVNRDVLRQEVETLETEQTNFAEEARRDVADVKAELQNAKQTEVLRDKEFGEARRHLDFLEDRRKRREEIGAEAVRLEGEWNQQRTLADLLGKNRLQLHLVRQAERQVVEYANSVLDRLSGGQLFLKLRDELNGEDNSTKALELEAYNRVTGEKPINVAFLSGSQKFRVAVSLALGIGQCASHQHRPIESVIIDEGFGCLDSQGRQVMIQELQNLRTQMRCILLVSHQEEFAEAFSDGYHFELESGTARVKPFRK